MAPRAQWKGYLRLSLVTVPVQLYSALDPEHELRLHQIHKPTGERVRYEKTVPGVGPVESDDIALGYEIDDGEHVLLEPEELRAAMPEASDTIEIVQFVAADELDDIYVERPFFVVPANKIGDEAYRVLRAALHRTRKIAVGEMVLNRRERVVAIRACGRGLMLFTLRYADELRRAERFFADVSAEEPKPELVALTASLIERVSSPFDPSRFHDDYDAALRALVRAKLRERQRPRVPTPTLEKLGDLRQVLEHSLEGLPVRSANRNEPQRPRATKRLKSASQAAAAKA